MKKFSEEHKKHLKEAAIKRCTPEWREEKSASMTGRKYGPPSEETVLKIKTATKGKNKGKVPWNKGLTRETDERVAKNGRATGKTKQGVHWKGDGRIIWSNGTDDIPLSKYKEMFKKQNGVCAICGKPESRKYKDKIVRLSIDHNHSTGKLRGLLCHRCNVALGLFLENTNFLSNAVRYLEKGGT